MQCHSVQPTRPSTGEPASTHGTLYTRHGFMRAMRTMNLKTGQPFVIEDQACAFPTPVV